MRVMKVVLFFIFTLLFFGANTEAALVDDLRKDISVKGQEIQKLEEEAKALREQVLAKEREAKTLHNQIGQIDLSLKKLTSDVRLTETRVSRTRLEIQELGEEISEKERSIERSRRDLGRLLSSISRKDEEGVVGVLAKYDSLGQFFNSVYYLLGLERGMHERLNDLRALKKELEGSRARAELKKTELAGLLTRLGDQKEIREGEKKERSVIFAETKNQEKKFQQLLELTEAQQEAIQKEIEELEDKLREAVDPGSLPSRREGVLRWPAEGTVSQGYGRTAFARLSHFYRFHNGIDIKSDLGSPIVAADDGEVIATGDTDRYCRRGAYGKYIVIRHNSNLATLYAHLSLIRVAAGERVDRGALIGYMGLTGLSTGPHLHFTVYDSRTVDIRQSRLCGPLPYGGSINPLDYL